MGRTAWVRELIARTALALSVLSSVTGLLAASLLRPTPVNLLLAGGAPLIFPANLVGAAALPVATLAYIYAGAAFSRGLPGAQWAGWLDVWPWIPAVVLVPTVG